MDLDALSARVRLSPAVLSDVLHTSLGEDPAGWFRLWLIHDRGMSPVSAKQLASAARQAGADMEAWVAASDTARVRARRSYIRRLWDQWQGERG